MYDDFDDYDPEMAEWSDPYGGGYRIPTESEKQRLIKAFIKRHNVKTRTLFLMLQILQHAPLHAWHLPVERLFRWSLTQARRLEAEKGL